MQGMSNHLSSTVLTRSLFLLLAIHWFGNILKQLFTSVSVNGGEYLPRLFEAQWISTTSHLHFGEQLLNSP